MRNYYNDSEQNSYDMNASLDYEIGFPYSKWAMFIGPKFAQTYQSVKGLKYRLDEAWRRLDSQSGADVRHAAF